MTEHLTKNQNRIQSRQNKRHIPAKDNFLIPVRVTAPKITTSIFPSGGQNITDNVFREDSIEKKRQTPQSRYDL